MREEMESIWNAMKGQHYKRTIRQLTESIKDVRSLDDALPAALEMVLNAIHAQTGTFWFYDRFRDGRIHPRVACDGANMAEVSLLPGEGIAGQVIRSGQPVIIPDCQADPRWAGRVDEKTGFQTKTMICVPMKADGTVFGSIQIINKTDGLSFDEKDLAFAEGLADEVAQLLWCNGLLEEYLDAAQQGQAGSRREPSFREVLLTGTEKEMEHRLRGMAEFSALRCGEQQEVLRLAQEMRAYFVRKN